MTAVPSADPSLDRKFAARDVRINAQRESRAFRLTYEDYAFAATTGTVSFMTISNDFDARIFDVTLKVDAEMSGGSISATFAAVGKTNGPDLDAYIDGADVFSGTGRVGNTAAEKGVDLDVAEDANVLPAGESLTLTLAATGGNLDTMDQGDVQVIVDYALYPEAPAAA